ncbi:sulfate transporter, partial [Trifolium medium]|nr:sulfate transporter [Trifolium medium]
VRARVASFDRFDRNVPAEEKGSRSQGDSGAANKVVQKDGRTKPVPRIDGEECAKMTRSAAPSGAHIATEDVTGETSSAADVRVGDVVLKLRKRFEQAGRKEVFKQGDGLLRTGTEDVPKDPEHRALVRNYHTLDDDMRWAKNGLVASIVNGEAVPVVQSRVMDAGFNDVVLIPMGADKVFVR